MSLTQGSTTEWAWEQWAGKNFESSRVYRVPPDIGAGYKEIDLPYLERESQASIPYHWGTCPD